MKREKNELSTKNVSSTLSQQLEKANKSKTLQTNWKATMNIHDGRNQGQQRTLQL